ncbi:MAG: hypothetical protein ACJA0N_001958 [Pseudohongiellaceae bacterium]|jgi:hypothetical protein
MPLSSPPYQQQGKIIPISILVLLAISLAITVVLFGPKEVKKSFMARSIGDAADSCEEEIIDYFDDRLISKYYDEISSRHEPHRKQYTVYYRVSHAETVDELPTVEHSMAKCVIWESLGYVSEFRVFKP